MAELLKATKNFSTNMIIGNGDSFVLYKARLSNGKTVAVKRLDPAAFPGFREFRAEVETLGKLRHPNIVKLLGYNASGTDGLFVYEFLEKGNLQSWLHHHPTFVELSWQVRLCIVRGVADGLAYLHGLESPIVHRDIKAENVLLDSEFQAHITNFGLARRIDSTAHSHVSTLTTITVANRGHAPPEYKLGSPVATLSGDVFSFGIYMLEVATGRLPNLQLDLLDWVNKMLACYRYMELVDSKILRSELDVANVKEYFQIACLCASQNSQHRPNMGSVAALLSHLV